MQKETYAFITSMYIYMYIYICIYVYIYTYVIRATLLHLRFCHIQSLSHSHFQFCLICSDSYGYTPQPLDP